LSKVMESFSLGNFLATPKSIRDFGMLKVKDIAEATTKQREKQAIVLIKGFMGV